MQIDASTVLLFGLLVKVLLAVLFLIFWFNGVRTTWFAWWSATFFLGSLTALLLLVGGFRGAFFGVGAATALLITCFRFPWFSDDFDLPPVGAG
jgi:hypothetical protein